MKNNARLQVGLVVLVCIFSKIAFGGEFDTQIDVRSTRVVRPGQGTDQGYSQYVTQELLDKPKEALVYIASEKIREDILIENHGAFDENLYRSRVTRYRETLDQLVDDTGHLAWSNLSKMRNREAIDFVQEWVLPFVPVPAPLGTALDKALTQAKTHSVFELPDSVENQRIDIHSTGFKASIYPDLLKASSDKFAARTWSVDDRLFSGNVSSNTRIGDSFVSRYSVNPKFRAKVFEENSRRDLDHLFTLHGQSEQKLKDNEDLLKDLQAQSAASVLKIKDIEAQIQSLQTEAANRARKQETEEAKAQAELQFQVALGEFRGGVDLIAFAVDRGFGDPKAAKSISTIGHTAANLVNAHHLFGNGKMGALALTSGYLGAAVALSSLSTMGRPTADQVTHAMLKQLGEQIAELRKTVLERIDTLEENMHRRFDRVDAKLNQLLTAKLYNQRLVEELGVSVTHELKGIAELIQQTEAQNYNVTVLQKCLNVDGRLVSENKTKEEVKDCVTRIFARMLDRSSATASRLDIEAFRSTRRTLLEKLNKPEFGNSLEFPFEEHLPEIFAFTNYFGGGRRTIELKKLSPEKQARGLGVTIPKQSYFIDDAQRIFSLVSEQPRETSLALVSKRSCEGLTDREGQLLKQMTERGREYVGQFASLLQSESDEKGYELDTQLLNRIVDSYQRSAEQMAKTADERARFEKNAHDIADPKKPTYHPGLGASQKFLPNGSATSVWMKQEANGKADPTRIAMCDGSSSYAVLETALSHTPRLKSEVDFVYSRSVPTGGMYTQITDTNKVRQFFENRVKQFPVLTSVPDMNDLVPNEFKWAYRHGFGFITACFSRFNVKRVDWIRNSHHETANANYNLDLELKVLYHPLKEVTADGYPKESKNKAPVVVAVHTANPRFLLRDKKIRRTSILEPKNQFASFFWNGGIYYGGDRYAGSYCRERGPGSGAHCWWEEKKGVKDQIAKIFATSKTQTEAVTAEGKKLQAQIQKDFSSFYNEVRIGFESGTEVRDNTISRLTLPDRELATRVDRTVEYLNAVLVVGATPLYDRFFLPYFGNEELRLPKSQALIQSVFLKGETQDQVKQRIARSVEAFKKSIEEAANYSSVHYQWSGIPNQGWRSKSIADRASRVETLLCSSLKK